MLQKHKNDAINCSSGVERTKTFPKGVAFELVWKDNLDSTRKGKVNSMCQSIVIQKAIPHLECDRFMEYKTWGEWAVSLEM